MCVILVCVLSIIWRDNLERQIMYVSIAITLLCIASKQKQMQLKWTNFSIKCMLRWRNNINAIEENNKFQPSWKNKTCGTVKVWTNKMYSLQSETINITNSCGILTLINYSQFISNLVHNAICERCIWCIQHQVLMIRWKVTEDILLQDKILLKKKQFQYFIIIRYQSMAFW